MKRHGSAFDGIAFFIGNRAGTSAGCSAAAEFLHNEINDSGLAFDYLNILRFTEITPSEDRCFIFADLNFFKQEGAVFKGHGLVVVAPAPSPAAFGMKGYRSAFDGIAFFIGDGAGTSAGRSAAAPAPLF